MNWCGYEWKTEMEGGRIIHPNMPYMWYSEDCVEVLKDNTLKLTIKKDPKEITYWGGNIYHPDFAVGLIRTQIPFEFGEFSLDIKCPQGSYLWPSFWLSGDESWPPEVDIMESWSDDKGYFRATQPKFPWLKPGWRTTNNVIYNEKSSTGELHQTGTGSENIPWCKQTKNPAKNFINYSCLWTPDEIIFKVNGKKIRTIGKEICHKLTENIEPGKSYLMDVIINFWCQDPQKYKVEAKSDLYVKNFKYKRL